jgi:thiamine-monophosphate kinase
MHELELIERIRCLFDGGRGPGVEVGIGDDAAILDLGGARAVLTTDAQVEGVHFDRRWSTPREIGARAVEVNLSDLAAMGASPRALLLSLAMRPGDHDAVLEVVAGFAERARARGCPVVGGNVTRSAELSLTVTAVGALAAGRPALLRAGARAGDLVFVTGPIGGAALGLRLLGAGLGDAAGAAAAIACFRAPVARLDVGSLLPGLATAALDLSDGLTQDLGHLVEASGVAAIIELPAVPTLPGHAELAARAGADAALLVVGGGEDYELLFTAPAEGRGRAGALGGREIGRIVAAGPGPRVRIVDANGAEVPVTRRGFEHF